MKTQTKHTTKHSPARLSRAPLTARSPSLTQSEKETTRLPYIYQSLMSTIKNHAECHAHRHNGAPSPLKTLLFAPGRPPVTSGTHSRSMARPFPPPLPQGAGSPRVPRPHQGGPSGLKAKEGQIVLGVRALRAPLIAFLVKTTEPPIKNSNTRHFVPVSLDAKSCYFDFINI